jgi:uncharacterized protein YjiS (DUF1127 family)
MSTTTATFGHQAADITDRAPRKTLWQRLTEASVARGEARVRAQFARMSDHHLADIGFSPDQIRSIRAKGSVPDDFWA